MTRSDRMWGGNEDSVQVSNVMLGITNAPRTCSARTVCTFHLFICFALSVFVCVGVCVCVLCCVAILHMNEVLPSSFLSISMLSCYLPPSLLPRSILPAASIPNSISFSHSLYTPHTPLLSLSLSLSLSHTVLPSPFTPTCHHHLRRASTETMKEISLVRTRIRSTHRSY